MAQVILIESNKTMNDLLSVNLTSFLGVDLIHRNNAQETISLLAILPGIDLIVTISQVDDEDTAEEINKYLLDHNLDINMIVIGKSLIQKNKNAIILENILDWEKVIQLSARVLGINEKSLAKKIIPDYVSVPVSYFLNLESVNCDVFIRIKKSPTEYQYVKRIHSGDSFSKDSIERYTLQGLDYFFIPKENHRNFAIFLSNKLVEKMESSELSESKKNQLMGESYEIATKEIIKLGFNSEIIQLTDAIINNMVKNFEKSPEMSSLLHKVINSKTGVLYQRCHMTSIVACEMIKNLKLKDQFSYEKVAFAAFFHDIKLAEHEEYSKINSFEELERAELNESDWELVFNHAHDAADLVNNHPEAPLGADEIIRHHHGGFNGKGFSNVIEKLPDISKIFIIAHNFVLELMKFKEKGAEPRPITDELYKRYPTPDAAIMIKALEKTLKKKK
ncbi:MAG: hypothetical protein HOP07_16505 [Bacteriovoracaceae bacterium]|nr:hypothetical protein [Bacteriovoracaceae bacterium]